MFPLVTLLVPIFETMRSLNLLNTRWVMGVELDGAKLAVGHAYGGGSQYFAMWVVGADKP